MHDLGIGTTHETRSVISGIFLPSWQFREYTLPEKVNLWRGKIAARSREFGLWETMLATDLTQMVTDLAVPVYFLHGRYDYTCAYPLATAYFDQLQAPLKGFYTFESSAHSPVYEEPERTLQILLEDVRNGTTVLADER
jgi:pimeloyl-ACP methyl ester carboxylesterase